MGEEEIDDVYYECGMSMSWKSDALCQGMETSKFFPGRGQPTNVLKDVCRSCPVVKPCLEYSFRSAEKFGIWGGTSEKERRRVRSLKLRCKLEGIETSLSEIIDALDINYTSMEDEDLVPFTGDDYYR